jgi:hypothetical protein
MAVSVHGKRPEFRLRRIALASAAEVTAKGSASAHTPSRRPFVTSFIRGALYRL